MRSAAGSLKRVTLELGGNDPAIVLPDVDPKEVAPQLFWAAFQNNAQFCNSTKRLYVHEDVYDELLARARRVHEDRQGRRRRGQPTRRSVRSRTSRSIAR